MSKPPNVKKLWKNIDWKNKEEKLAFYNKYFKGKEFVNEDIEKAVQSFKDDILRYIENNKVTEKDKTRPLTIGDIKDHIKNAMS